MDMNISLTSEEKFRFTLKALGAKHFARIPNEREKEKEKKKKQYNDIDSVLVVSWIQRDTILAADGIFSTQDSQKGELDSVLNGIKIFGGIHSIFFFLSWF